MAERSLDLLQSLLRGLAAGAEPTQVLREGLSGAMAATSASQGAVLRLQGGRCTTVVTAGRVAEPALATARAAITAGRMVRRRDAETGVTSAAEPLRAGSRVLGAVVVGGSLDELDAGRLPLFASALSLALERHPAATPAALPDLLASLAAVASDLDTGAMAARVLDAAHVVFGAASGLCALLVDGAMRVTRFRGIEPERLIEASRHPEFRTFLSGEGVRVDEPDHPVVERLSVLGEVAVGLPLVAGGRQLGRLVLLLPAPPDPATRSLLQSFGGHVSVCVLTSRLSRELGDHEQRLTSIAHSLPQPLVMVDEGGRVMEINAAASQAFHLAPGFERGQPVSGRLGHPALEEMLVSGRDGTAEVVVGLDEPRVYRAAVRRLRDADGRVNGRVLVLDDVTGERQMDALKSDFVAVIGHELRTPITVVKGYLKSLVRRGASMTEERRAQALTAVESNVDRLERLIEDLLFISAIEQRSGPLDLRPTELGALLRERAGPRVVVRTPPEPVHVEVDEARVAQVVHHLLDNALKYSEGDVAVELADAGDVVEVAVVDSGPGIFSGDVPHLFERFRQLDGTSTRGHGGVGIGLYICRRVVESMGGRIWCESRLGVGSRFVFSLPKSAVAASVA